MQLFRVWPAGCGQVFVQGAGGEKLYSDSAEGLLAVCEDLDLTQDRAVLQVIRCTMGEGIMAIGNTSELDENTWKIGIDLTMIECEPELASSNELFGPVLRQHAGKIFANVLMAAYASKLSQLVATDNIRAWSGAVCLSLAVFRLASLAWASFSCFCSFSGSGPPAAGRYLSRAPVTAFSWTFIEGDEPSFQVFLKQPRIVFFWDRHMSHKTYYRIRKFTDPSVPQAYLKSTNLDMLDAEMRKAWAAAQAWDTNKTEEL